MRSPAPGGPLFALFWRLYIVMGVISLAAGAYMLGSPRLIVPSAGVELAPVRIIGLILIVFGIVRIVNSVLQIRRMGRS